MNICLQLLIYTVLSKEDRAHLRKYWRERRRDFIERHIIADDPYDELTRKAREEEEKNKDKE